MRALLLRSVSGPIRVYCLSSPHDTSAVEEVQHCGIVAVEIWWRARELTIELRWRFWLAMRFERGLVGDFDDLALPFKVIWRASNIMTTLLSYSTG